MSCVFACLSVCVINSFFSCYCFYFLYLCKGVYTKIRVLYIDDVFAKFLANLLLLSLLATLPVARAPVDDAVINSASKDRLNNSLGHDGSFYKI